ncbi:uncharacterized protein I303_108502 [Kwoniella dejecticola CBS 10117]|uniref:Uncharacterized protein n=1 Tax=Kwoniella dejecticola CBS 10117 TaxID=1296121 RepID=A0A1A5ZX83_9TREE|nr:uncharacterized protein I303_07174 [Kwoniella dejecticola CBS 10117]OBR82415.1 hypothetical protein I303_07174 [Kwoniella dejecticola CBS 10117]
MPENAELDLSAADPQTVHSQQTATTPAEIHLFHELIVQDFLPDTPSGSSTGLSPNDVLVFRDSTHPKAVQPRVNDQVSVSLDSDAGITEAAFAYHKSNELSRSSQYFAELGEYGEEVSLGLTAAETRALYRNEMYEFHAQGLHDNRMQYLLGAEESAIDQMGGVSNSDGGEESRLEYQKCSAARLSDYTPDAQAQIRQNIPTATIEAGLDYKVSSTPEAPSVIRGGSLLDFRGFFQNDIAKKAFRIGQRSKISCIFHSSTATQLPDQSRGTGAFLFSTTISDTAKRERHAAARQSGRDSYTIKDTDNSLIVVGAVPLGEWYAKCEMTLTDEQMDTLMGVTDWQQQMQSRAFTITASGLKTKSDNKNITPLSLHSPWSNANRSINLCGGVRRFCDSQTAYEVDIVCVGEVSANPPVNLFRARNLKDANLNVTIGYKTDQEDVIGISQRSCQHDGSAYYG